MPACRRRRVLRGRDSQRPRPSSMTRPANGRQKSRDQEGRRSIRARGRPSTSRDLAPSSKVARQRHSRARPRRSPARRQASTHRGVCDALSAPFTCRNRESRPVVASRHADRHEPVSHDATGRLERSAGHDAPEKRLRNGTQHSHSLDKQKRPPRKATSTQGCVRTANSHPCELPELAEGWYPLAFVYYTF